jgi:hypothetical protein
VREWTRFEAFYNLSLANQPVTQVCSYDAGRLPPAVIDAACKTHEHTLSGTTLAKSAKYADQAELVLAG